MCFRFLATGCSFRSLAFTFRMGKTTISKIVVETCSAIWDKLLPSYLPEPTVDMWKSNSNDFYKNWNFPNCLGSIDGKHIRIHQPQNSGSMYYNYKHFFSIHLLAVSDANYKFVMVDIGAYGRESDGGVLKNSEFFKKLQNKKLNIPNNAELPNTNIKVPYTFIGDEAFPLLVNILRPYPGKQLVNNNKKKVFNYRLSRARRTVENTFGILSSKWRILNKAIETNIENAILITKAVCILHNVVLTHNKQPIQNIIQNLSEEKVANISDGRRNNRFGTDARDTREIFADYFISEYGSVPWQMDYI